MAEQEAWEAAFKACLQRPTWTAREREIRAKSSAKLTGIEPIEGADSLDVFGVLIESLKG